jgi:putative membrane protein
MIIDPAVSPYPFAPYCGAPPAVASLWRHWNLDPVLIVGLLCMAVGYAVATGRRGPGRWPPRPWRRACFQAGWTVGCLALVSPLCALSVSLFSARVGQHMLLTCVVAPLTALGLPPMARWARRAELPAAAAFAAALWFWHAPGPYAASFNGPGPYWLMHLTLFASALWFWKAVLDAPPERMAIGAAAALATSLQMAFLGAVVTFAATPLYAPHTLTTWAWGLTPLADQQLGGAIMWVPAGAIFVAAILAPLAVALRASPATTPSAT